MSGAPEPRFPPSPTVLLLMALACISIPGSAQTAQDNPAHHLARLIGSWDFENVYRSEDGRDWLGAELRFAGNDRAVWTGYRNVSSTSITSWVESSREVWIRRAP